MTEREREREREIKEAILITVKTIYRRYFLRDTKSSEAKYYLNRRMLIATDSRVEAWRVRNQNFASRDTNLQFEQIVRRGGGEGLGKSVTK
jgi:hypothetical protein